MTWTSMVRDRFVLALAAAAVAFVGVVALSWSTSLNDYDRWGFRIHCGSGLTADYDQAAIADAASASHPMDGQTGRADDYVAQCHSAIWLRRSWAGLLVLVGAGSLVVVVTRYGERKQPSSEGSAPPRP